MPIDDAEIEPRSTDGQAASFQVVFEDDPYSNEALDRTETMREALAPLEAQS